MRLSLRLAFAATVLAVFAAALIGGRVIAGNGATVDDLCEIAQNQRDALEQQKSNSTLYLKSSAGKETTPLNDFVRRISLPQLEARLKAEQVPDTCQKRLR